ncbi:MAG TPA: hypothetical protein VFJ85_05860 [Acidimicrobiales bacterium]|nr:hypothetical protein [Acidimicrobiales bacterium]
MGSGRWSTDVYTAAASYRAATGRSAFDWSDRIRRRPRGDWVAHPTLDPRGVAARESRDSDEHPTSLAIAVLFDVTGSMGNVPVVLQTKLPQLFGLLVRKGYAAHPQVLFGAIGDATCDRVPLQIGQFESDNRTDTDLGNILLEGGGGGQMTESYELALYFMARHSSIDCFERRGRRGYLFVIGDELAYPEAKAEEVRRVIGDDLAENVPLAQVLAEARRRYDVYYVLPQGAHYAGDDRVLAFWRHHLGQNVIQLDDLDAVCETIALTIGLGEGSIDVATGLADLDDVGSDKAATVGRALARLGPRALIGGGPLPAGGGGPSGAVRL